MKSDIAQVRQKEPAVRVHNRLGLARRAGRKQNDQRVVERYGLERGLRLVGSEIGVGRNPVRNDDVGIHVGKDDVCGAGDCLANTP